VHNTPGEATIYAISGKLSQPSPRFVRCVAFRPWGACVATTLVRPQPEAPSHLRGAMPACHLLLLCLHFPTRMDLASARDAGRLWNTPGQARKAIRHGHRTNE
jgi:hypothetical protein